MRRVLLDTSGLIALTNVKDQRHGSASDLWSELYVRGNRLFTTSLVLVEYGDGMSRVDRRATALRLRESLLAADLVQIIEVTPATEIAAWRKFERHQDKDWGVTDCASFVVMDGLKIQDAFTADRHFRQAGFNPLLAAE
ncbi:MAG: PIN domain-containing protein [Planctomycetota bacterium]